jgi:hypothetical protein
MVRRTFLINTSGSRVLFHHLYGIRQKDNTFVSHLYHRAVLYSISHGLHFIY